MGFSTIKFLFQHPLSSRRKFFAFKQYLTWQIASRMIKMPIVVSFVGNSRLLISHGMTGATGNLYAGLHEFEDMSFTLHALRKDDLFVDVGANIGSYTILASACAKSNCIAIEPVFSTYSHLVDNVNLNSISSQVECLNIGIGKEKSILRFSTELDTTNHILSEEENRNTSNNRSIAINVETLDNLLLDRKVLVIKIDVEGWETEVIAGADETLSSQNPLAIIMEFGNGANYHFDENILHEKMLSHGFETFVYEPFTRNLISLKRQRKEFGNTIYIKDVDFFRGRLISAPKYQVFGTQL